MSSLTSRLKLVKAALTDPANVVTYVSDAFDKIDAAAGLTLCTKTTRPSSPYVGQWVLETDTGRKAFWDGTGWYCMTGGTYVGACNAFGDLNLTGLGFTSFTWFNGVNGDVTRTNVLVAVYNPFPSGATIPGVRCWTANTGAAFASNMRINWVAEGYLA